MPLSAHTLPKLLLISLFAPLVALAQTPQGKIQDELLNEILEQGRAEFLIILNAQADLSKAELFLHKTDKTRYVARQLRHIAQRTQTPVIQLLEKENAPYRPFFIINAIRAKGDWTLLQKLAAMPEVRELQANPRVPLRFPSANTSPNPASPRGIEWGITQIQADTVWALGHKGNGVVVGGQDTGVDWEHPAIKNKYRGWDGTTADHNYNWHDAIHAAGGSNPCGSDSPTPCDDHNHGTHVTGTMTGDDGGSNQIGVAPDAQWIACRNMDQGNGTPATYIECFEWFLEPTDLNDANPDPAKAPDVINNSWGCPPSEGCNSSNFATMDSVVNNLVAAGIVVVVSAGNSGPNCSTVDDPAAIFQNSFTVGATQSNDSIASFSSRGPVTVDSSNRLKPDISAPGVGVRSCIRNGQYATWSGTSMAGPHVVGTVALMLSARPDMKGQVATIENLIEQNALQLTSSQSCGGTSGNNIPNNTYGHGRINALAAVQAILAFPVELTSFHATCTDQGIEIQWETALETDFSHFTLLRSSDLEQWEVVQTIPSSPFGKYRALDQSPPPAKYQYHRLQMFNADGSFEYSKVISSSCNRLSPNNIRLYPNPTEENITITLSPPPDSHTLLLIYDATGRLVQQETLPPLSDSYSLPLQNLSPGFYFLQIKKTNGNILAFAKFAKSK